MKFYVIDAEAKLNEQIAVSWFKDNPDKDFPPPFAWEIICLGSARLNDQFLMEKLDVGCIIESERDGLELFSEVVGANKTGLITWNGRKFDLPVISYRCLHYGIPMRWYHTEKSPYKNRYSTEMHYDLHDYLSEFGGHFIKMDHIAKLIGLPGKIGISGEDVEKLYKENKIDEIVSYCITDILQNYLIFLRLELLRGFITKDRYIFTVKDCHTKIKLESEQTIHSNNRTLLGNSFDKKTSPWIARGCKQLLDNWDVEATCQF